MTTATLPSAPSLGQRRQVLLVFSLILLLVSGALLAYGNSLAGPLVLDDAGTIRDNVSLRKLWPPGALLHPPGVGSTVQGRPVLNLTFALNYAAGGLNVRGYHATNLAIHILAGLALFGLVRRTLRLPSIRPGATGRTPLWAADQCPESTDCGSTGQPKAAGQWHPGFGSPGTADLLAFGVALIWLLHPLQTSAVTYLSQRAESLVGLWYLLTLYCALRGMTVGGPSRWRAWLWYFLAILTCALGMGSKEVMVSAPLIVLLLDRVLVSGSWRELWQRRWGLYVGLAATWILLVVLVWTAQSRGGTAGAHTGISHWHYLLTQAWAIPHYLRLAFWPQPLVFDYGTSVITSLATVWPQMLLMALLLVLTIACWFRFRAVALLLTAFFAILAPSSSFVPVATQTVAEHRMYLPLAVVVILVVIGLFAAGKGACDWCRRWNSSIAPQAVKVLGCLAGVALVAVPMALGFTTYSRNEVYQSALGLWEDTRVKVPHNQRVYNSLGGIYLASGDLERALSYFDQAVATAPGDADSYANRGLVYQRWDQHDRAVAEFSRALELHPTLNVGDLYCSRGVSLEALARAALVAGDVPRCQALLQRALADLNEALDLQPELTRALNSRGNCYHALGQDDRAFADYAAAMTVDPTYVTPYFNRAKVYWSLKRYDDAWADVRRGRALGAQPPAEFLELLRKDSGRLE